MIHICFIVEQPTIRTPSIHNVRLNLALKFKYGAILLQPGPPAVSHSHYFSGALGLFSLLRS